MVYLGALLLIAAIVVAAAVLLTQANTGTTESLTLFGHNFDTTAAGGFLAGAVVGAVALVGVALIASKFAGAAGRRNADRRAETERAALTEEHQRELEQRGREAQEQRSALAEQHQHELERRGHEAEAQRIALAEQHQQEIDRQREEGERDRASLVQEHEQQLAHERQAVRSAVERALGGSGAATPSDFESAAGLGTAAAATGAAGMDVSDAGGPDAEGAEPSGEPAARAVSTSEPNSEPATQDDVEPLAWHGGRRDGERESAKPVYGFDDHTRHDDDLIGRHHETGDNDDDGSHKNLWQRVVEKVEQRRHN